MLLVDSSVWIDYFNGRETQQTNYLDKILGSIPVLVGDLILTEVLQGFTKDDDFESARKVLASLEVVGLVNPEMAVQSAQNYRLLRTKGITVRKTIDSIIATYCIEYEHELLHCDYDFGPYEKYLGLRVVQF